MVRLTFWNVALIRPNLKKMIEKVYEFSEDSQPSIEETLKKLFEDETTTPPSSDIHFIIHSGSKHNIPPMVKLNKIKTLKISTTGKEVGFTIQKSVDFTSDNESGSVRLIFEGIQFASKENAESLCSVSNLKVELKMCSMVGFQWLFKGKSSVKVEECSSKSSCGSGFDCSESSEVTFLKTTSESHQRNGVKCQKQCIVNISDCTFFKNNGNGCLIQDDSQVMINNSSFKKNETFGILTYHNANVDIMNCEVSFNTQSGINLSNTDNKTRVLGCKLVKNKENGLAIIGMSNKGHMEIGNNQISNNEFYGIHVADGVGISNSVHHNTVHSNSLGAFKDENEEEEASPATQGVSPTYNGVINLQDNDFKSSASSSCLLN